MKNLNSFKFSAWRDGDRKACYMELDAPEADLNRMSFYMSADEFRDFALGRRDSFGDISNYLNIFIDLCTFYRMEFPKHYHGTINVPYLRIDFPTFARKILLRWADRIWRGPSTIERPSITVNKERLARWVKLYGIGAGRSEFVFNSDDTKELWNKQIGSNNFMKNVNQLERTAKNSTSRFWQKAKVHISKDWDGFFFSLPGMHGGLINHGTEEKPDWSIHT